MAVADTRSFGLGVERSDFMVAWFDGRRFVWWLRLLALTTAVVVGVTLSAPVASAEPESKGAAAEAAETEGDGDGGELSAADEVSARVSARASGERVLVEDATTVSSRSWVNPDGSMTVEEAGVPVRFLDSTGAWRDIDTTIKADAKGSAAVAASPLGVSLAGKSRAAAGGERGAAGTDLVALVEPAGLQESGEVLARVKAKDGEGNKAKDGGGAGSGRVSVAWPGVLPAPTIKGDTALYSEVSPGVDVSVQARRSGWEQLTILKNPAAVDAAVKAGDGVASWDLVVSTDGLTVRAGKDGGVEFVDPAQAKEAKDGKDGDGGVVSFIAPMRAWDALVDEHSGEHLSQAAVSVEVIHDEDAGEKGTGRVTLRLVPDQEWLTSKDRVFPVTIDPTYASGSLTATFDTYIDSGQPNLTYHTDTELKAGTHDGGGRKLRSYIKFNTTALAGKKIVSATLDLYETWSWSCTAKPVNVKDAANVTSSTTWATLPAVGTTTGTLTVAKGFSSSCPAGTIKIPIKEIAQAWADGTNKAGAGIGVVRVMASESDVYGWKRFRSSETTSPPKLTYTYNRAPGKASAPTVSGGKSYTPPGGTAAVYTTATKPTLTSTSTDADGNKVQILFEALTSTSSSTVVSSCTTSPIASGTPVSCTLGTALSNNSQYVVRAKVKDDQGLWQATASSWTTIRIATSAPPIPTITCAGYSHNSWHTGLPSTPVSCTASVSGTGYSGPASMTVVVDGVSLVEPAGSSGSVSKSFSIANTSGLHTVSATAVSGSGKASGVAAFEVGFGAGSLTRPVKGLSSTGTVAMDGGIPKPSTSGYVARTQWRLAGEAGAEGAWENIGPDLTATVAGSQVKVVGQVDLREIAGAGINPRVSITLQLRACLIPSGGGTLCTAGATSPVTVVRLPDAFGSGYPVDDSAGVGAVALFTGELGVDATDVDFAGQSVSRRHTSFAGDGTTDVVHGVFGPGWVGELGAASGMAEAVVSDRTKDDGTIVVDDGSGDPLIYARADGLRGKYTLAGNTFVPVTDITFESEVILRLKEIPGGTGVGQHRLELVEPDGTVTAFAPDTALTATVAPSSTAILWRPETVTDPEDAGSAEAKTYFYPVSASDHKIKRIVRVPVGKTSANCPGGTDPTASSRGCQYLDFTYGTASTGGDRVGQVKTVTARMWDPAAGGGAGAMTSVTMAAYTYDSSTGRLATVTDSRTGLVTKYGWDGASTRLATVTPPGLAPYRIWYDTTGGAPKVARVTRDNPASNATYGTLVATTRPSGSQVLAGYRYGLTPTTVTGLNVAAGSSGVGRWHQKSAPTQGFAVFDGGAPTTVTDDTATSIAGVTAGDWQYADLSFTDTEGYTVNTATYGAGRWLPTSTDYDDKGLITRSLDAAAIAEILDTPEVESKAETDLLSSVNVYNADGLVTDSYGPARDVLLNAVVVQGVRTHTKTLYDQGAPAEGNPATQRAFNLPTTVEVHASNAAGLDVAKLSWTVTGYGPVSTDGAGNDGYSGWATGNATHSIVKDLSGDTGKDITSVTKFDARHRVIETRQPLAASKSAHAGVMHTRYYTTGTHPTDGACSNRPEWEGLVCKILPGDSPKNSAGTVTGAPAPTVTYTYDKWGNTATETETVVHSGGTTTRTTTSGFDAAGRQTSTALAVSGLAGSSGATARPGTTTVYSSTTGAVSETHLTGATSTKESTTYDGWGRMVTATNQDGETSSTTYDTAGRVATIVNVTGTTTYGYNGSDADAKVERRGLATSATVTRAGTGGNLVYKAAYDAGGNLVTHTMPGKIAARSTYGLTGDQTSLTYTGQVTPVTEVIDPDTGEISWTPGTPVDDQAWLGWSRNYDTLGRVGQEYTSHGTSFDGVPGVTDPADVTAPDTGDAVAYTKSYGYDFAGRLVWSRDRTATGTGIAAVPTTETGVDAVFPCIQRDYTFDKNGNRTGDAIRAAANTCDWVPITSSNSYTYDTADRPIDAPSRVTPAGTITGGSYVYDTLWRQTTLPAADAPTPEGGNITLGYFDDDLPRVIAQGDTSTTFTLDVLGRRHTTTTTTGTVTTTTVNHYDDTSDNPAWTTRTGGGLPNETLRFTGGIDADLTAIITGTGDVTLNLSNPAGHLAATVTIPAAQAGTVAATGIGTWNDYTDYGAPKHTQTGAGSPATTALGGYGWYADKQRHTSAATAELTLLGVRLYNRVRGLFTTVDPIPGGNTTTYTYPQDPINQHDLDGQWKKPKWLTWRNAGKAALWGSMFIPGVGAAGMAIRGGMLAYRGYKAYKTARAVSNARRTFSNAGRSCQRNSFAPGTLVLLANGTTKPIEDIAIGDMVLATDPETGETAAEPVTDLITGNGVKELVKVGTDPDHDGVTDWITATDGHPFWVDQQGWTDAGDLQRGDLLVSDDGTLTEIVDLTENTQIAIVHNLTVNRIHTYYVVVGDLSLLVHNTNGPCDPAGLRSMSNRYLQKVLKKHGETPHSLKMDYLGSRAPIAKFDVRKCGKCGRLSIVNKKDPRISIPTHIRVRRR